MGADCRSFQLHSEWWRAEPDSPALSAGKTFASHQQEDSQHHKHQQENIIEIISHILLYPNRIRNETFPCANVTYLI